MEGRLKLKTKTLSDDFGVPKDFAGTIQISVRTEVTCSIPGAYSSASCKPEITVTCGMDEKDVDAAIEFVLRKNGEIIRADLPKKLAYCARLNSKVDQSGP